MASGSSGFNHNALETKTAQGQAAFSMASSPLVITYMAVCQECRPQVIGRRRESGASQRTRRNAVGCSSPAVNQPSRGRFLQLQSSLTPSWGGGLPVKVKEGSGSHAVG
jgi:hypothetical protein